MKKLGNTLAVLGLVAGFGSLMAILALIYSGKVVDIVELFRESETPQKVNSAQRVVSADEPETTLAPEPNLGPMPLPAPKKDSTPKPTPAPTPTLEPAPEPTPAISYPPVQMGTLVWPANVDYPYPSIRGSTQSPDSALGGSSSGGPPMPPDITSPADVPNQGPTDSPPSSSVTESIPPRHFNVGDTVRWVAGGGWIHQGEVQAARIDPTTNKWVYDILHQDGSHWNALEENRMGLVVEGVTAPFQPRIEGLPIHWVNPDGTLGQGIVEGAVRDAATGGWMYDVRLASGELVRTAPTVRILLSDVMVAPDHPPTSGQVPTSTTTCRQGQVELNTASFDDLRRIIHIDKERAGQILTLRQERPFASVDELTRIKGIADARLRDIKIEDLACAGPVAILEPTEEPPQEPTPTPAPTLTPKPEPTEKPTGEGSEATDKGPTEDEHASGNTVEDSVAEKVYEASLEVGPYTQGVTGSQSQFSVFSVGFDDYSSGYAVIIDAGLIATEEGTHWYVFSSSAGGDGSSIAADIACHQGTYLWSDFQDEVDQNWAGCLADSGDLIEFDTSHNVKITAHGGKDSQTIEEVEDFVDFWEIEIEDANGEFHQVATIEALLGHYVPNNQSAAWPTVQQNLESCHDLQEQPPSQYTCEYSSN